jgi:serine/threonine-protein kinase
MRKVARQLGRYHVLDRIAFGGMAEIFRAITFDAEDRGHLVAIKQVLPHYAEDREFIDMIVDEARLVSMLHHKNIVEIYEFGQYDEFYFLAMEYVWGKDLRAVLERCRAKSMRVPFEVSAYLMAEALAGLDTSHRLLDPEGRPAGLVHRDFSPSNVLLSYTGGIKICDFGIAKATFSRIETKTGVIKGKVKYMSPEQAFGRKLDHRSDLFSAGSCLYEMVTNEPPFMAKNEIDLIFMVRDAQFVPPTKRVDSIPRALEEIVFRSMARSRSARYQSAAEFRHALLTYLRQRGIGNWKAELGRFMQTLYKDEIRKEQSALYEYTLEPTHIGGDLGRNLIADVLGEGAAYTKFNPYPTRAFDPMAGGKELHEASTRMLDLGSVGAVGGVVGQAREAPRPLEDQATMILQTPESLTAGDLVGDDDATGFFSRPDDSERPSEAGLAEHPTQPAPPPMAGGQGSAQCSPTGPPPLAQPPPLHAPPRAPAPPGHRVAPAFPPGPSSPTAPPPAGYAEPWGALASPHPPPPRGGPPNVVRQATPPGLAAPVAPRNGATAPPPLPYGEPPRAPPPIPRPDPPPPPPLPVMSVDVGAVGSPPKAPPPSGHRSPPPKAHPPAGQVPGPKAAAPFGGDLDESTFSTLPFGTEAEQEESTTISEEARGRMIEADTEERPHRKPSTHSGERIAPGALGRDAAPQARTDDTNPTRVATPDKKSAP